MKQVDVIRVTFKVLFIIAVFSLGFYLGVQHDNSKKPDILTVMETYQDTLIYEFLTKEAAITYDTYSSVNDYNVKIHALNHFIEMVESVDRNQSFQAILVDVAFSYGRLGMIYELAGKNEQADIAYARALEILGDLGTFNDYKGTDKEINDVDELKGLLEMLDNSMTDSYKKLIN